MASTASTTKKGRQQGQQTPPPPLAPPVPKDRLDPFNLPPGLEVKGTKQYTLQIKISYETLRGWRLYRAPYLDDERALVDALRAKGADVKINEPEKHYNEKRYY